jgi:hypothetical protein
MWSFENDMVVYRALRVLMRPFIQVRESICVFRAYSFLETTETEVVLASLVKKAADTLEV